jgi:tRNA A-37 threonylcarbamoyl transferase component Bud32
VQVVVKPGDTIEGRYKIVRVLDQGGMGTVFLAEHVLIKRRVAIKILHAKYAQDTDVIDRFMNEARAAGTLGHPNIVESTDMGFTRDDVPYIVFEYLEGSLLTEEIYRHPNGLPVRRALKIAEQIASALQAAHNAGIIHRDLKSDNVFLTFKDEVPDHVKVLDFGISRFQEAEQDSRPHQLMGTPEFMSPEQVLHPGKVDRRADIWALGVILYEMLTARRPWRNDHDPHALLHSVVHDPPPPLVVPKAPPGLAEMIVEKLLAKDPEQRYPSMKEAQGALEAFRGVMARETGPVSADGIAPPAEMPPAAKLVELPPRPPHRTPWLVAGLAAVAAGTALLFVSKAAAPPPPKVDERPLVAAVESDADMLSRALDSELHAAHLRVEGTVQSPMLRSAIETDAATVRDLVINEMKLHLGPGEALTLYQMQNGHAAPLLHLPDTASDIALPGDGESRLDTDGKAVNAVVSAPISTQAGSIGGAIVLSVPVDLTEIDKRVATHTVEATLTGLSAPVPLAHGTQPAATQPKPVSTPVATPKDVKRGPLQLAAVIAIPEAAAAAAPGDPYALVRYGLWGIGALLVLIYVGSLLRGRASS